MVANMANDEAPKPSPSGRVVDVRSDTVTQPTEPMRKAMAEAQVGDDVFGDDPTVKALECRVAELLGKEAGLFVPSGTMANLLAMGTHCSGRGEEVICGRDAHVFFYEQGGASSLMGVVFNTLQNQADGTLDLEEVRGAIKKGDPHHAVAKLLCLENTHNRMGGKVVSLEYMARAGALCKELGLALHLDGARLWNAVAALGATPAEVVHECDSVSVCLSKALGAPVGSVLVGKADFVKRARHLRKALGGGMRQVGVLAAAGLYALEHHVQRLPEDHKNARRLADGLSALGLKVTPPDTNMVFWEVESSAQLGAALTKAGFQILLVDSKRCRAVPNLHTTGEDIDKLIAAVAEALGKKGGSEPPQKKPRGL